MPARKAKRKAETDDIEKLRTWFFDELNKLREQEIKILKEYDDKKQLYLKEQIKDLSDET
ncbi:MAG: hypothetical protein A2538_03840 [Candidatus Magasanikbacteria bacterium RIFOXYD2_FULL_41_14]|uniref:Uncharacterized protein n=1 Tax=Candidatus Magasanikbacteria bacterium RIFOXYD2_FULL_41_14 TaxID=1798709 RepID=A0A1F6PCX2_9BACT|nr:MAG: hypothetical protein A2538_03840 [Candidatus Magasanikbacteria bacterium RIFOXYD2_FULL_41_14]